MSSLLIWLPPILLIGTAWRWCRPRIMYSEERNIAKRYISEQCEPEVEEGPLATMSNFGVTRSLRWVSMMDDRAAVVFLVTSHFFRGGYPEGDCVYLVSVNRKQKAVINCVATQALSTSRVFDCKSAIT